jgi:hypothetical protein
MQPTAPRSARPFLAIAPALLVLLVCASPCAHADDAAASDTVSAPPVRVLIDPIASAKAHRLQRLEAEVAAIEEKLGELPPRLDFAKIEARSHLTAAEYETWLLDAERQDLRTRIDRLGVRIALLEEIEQHQELEDRARVVTLQNAVLALNSDRAEAEERARRARVDLNDAINLTAERVALHERLSDVDHQIRELSPALHVSDEQRAGVDASAALSLGPPASAQSPPEAPSAAPATAPAGSPAPFALAPGDGAAAPPAREHHEH